MSETQQRLSPLRALRHRDFSLLFVGQTISSTGSALQAVALTWLILSLHGSAIDVSLALLSLTVPQAALTFAGGLLIDRLDARFVIILADALRLGTAGALALLADHAAGHLWLIWGVLALHGTGNALFLPAAASIAPRLVKTEDLESANALTSAMLQIGPLVGYVPAGFLVAVGGPSLAFACNAASYAIAVILALLMRPLERSPREHNLVLHALRETAQYLRTVPWLLALFIMDCMVAFAGISTNSIGAPLLARNVFHAGVQGYSVLAWSYSSGAVVGFLLAALRPIRSHRGLLCIVFHGAEAVLLTTTAFVPLPFAVVSMAAWSAINGILVVVTLALIQQKIPASMLGRVTSVSILASTAMLPIAQFAGGFIASALGARSLFALAGGIILFSGVIGWCIPTVRTLD